jgi:hypothetical protein
VKVDVAELQQVVFAILPLRLLLTPWAELSWICASISPSKAAFTILCRSSKKYHQDLATWLLPSGLIQSSADKHHPV